MANKKIRDYVPGKNDYLQFAETMNKNAQIDFQSNNGEDGGKPTVQNPIVTNTNINAGVSTPNTQPLPIGAQAYSQIRGGFKGVLDDSIKGVNSKYTSVYGKALGDSFSQSLYDGGASGGKTESGETGNATGGVSNSAGSGSSAGAVTAPAAGGKLSYDNWMKDYGYDPETDYNQAKNDLEYQYMTYLNNYGARAEELYQMGLSGSGISDLYGVNAYSAYLAASNDLALARIEQENEYRRMYKAYSDEFDAAEQLKTETEKSEAGTIAANLVSQLNYSPEKAQSFRDYYKTQGKSDEWIDSVIESADALYNLNQSINNTSNTEQIINDAATAFAYQDGKYVYDGSETYKTYIRQMLNTSDYSMYAPYADEIIAKMDENLKANQDDMIEGTTNKLNATADTSPESIVSENLLSDYKSYSLQLSEGKITPDQFEEYAESLSGAALKAVQWAFSEDQRDFENLDKAYNLTGYTAEEWSELSAEEKGEAVMLAAGELYVKGVLKEKDYGEIFNDWYAQEIDNAGDINNFADIVVTLQEYKEKGYISQQKYDECLSEASENISEIKVKRGNANNTYFQINMKDGSSFKLQMNHASAVEDELDSKYYGASWEELEKRSDGLNRNELFECNGKLWYKTSYNPAKYAVFNNISYGKVNGEPSRRDYITELLLYYAKK